MNSEVNNYNVDGSFTVYKTQLTAKNTLTILMRREYFAVNKISLGAKETLNIIVQREHFIINQ